MSGISSPLLGEDAEHEHTMSDPEQGVEYDPNGRIEGQPNFMRSIGQGGILNEGRVSVPRAIDTGFHSGNHDHAGAGRDRAYRFSRSMKKSNAGAPRAR